MLSRRELFALGIGVPAYPAAVPGETQQATGCKAGEMTSDSARLWLRRTSSSQRLANGIVRRGHAREAKLQCHLLCLFHIVSRTRTDAFVFGEGGAFAPNCSGVGSAAGPVGQFALRGPAQHFLVFGLPLNRIGTGGEAGQGRAVMTTDRTREKLNRRGSRLACCAAAIWTLRTRLYPAMASNSSFSAISGVFELRLCSRSVCCAN